MRKSFLFLPLTKYVSSLAKSLEIEAYITTNVQLMPMNLEFYLQYKSDYISIKLHLLICYSKWILTNIFNINIYLNLRCKLMKEIK